jgi:hypothetical protein
VQTVSLAWQHAEELAAVLGAAGLGMRYSRSRALRAIAPFSIETAIIGALYGLWQLAGKLSVTGTDDALNRAKWIVRFEHDIRLPSEATMQNLILGHPLVVQAANLYYDTMHFTMMFVFLIWLFVRHRDRYRPVRTTMALTTLVCLVIQLIPVAPPRLLPGFIKDTAVIYHQSVYGGGYNVDQLSAMPSVHVAWAVIVGWYVARISTSKWRWIGPLHAAVTIFVVVVTGNHWWLDGIVAIAAFILCANGQNAVRKGVRALRDRHQEAPVLSPAT